MGYSMTQLSNKQNLLDIQIKSLNDMNKLLLELIVDTSYINTDSMNSIKDICDEIKKCAIDIQAASDKISNYATLADVELKELIKANETKTLKSTLDTWDATKAANAIAEAGSILPVVDNGEVKENG